MYPSVHASEEAKELLTIRIVVLHGVALGFGAALRTCINVLLQLGVPSLTHSIARFKHAVRIVPDERHSGRVDAHMARQIDDGRDGVQALLRRDRLVVRRGGVEAPIWKGEGLREEPERRRQNRVQDRFSEDAPCKDHQYT